MTSDSASASSIGPGLRLVSGTPASPPKRVRTTQVRDTNALVSRIAVRVRAGRADRTRDQRAKDHAELLSSISHELRTPLTSVLGYTEVLLCQEAGELTAEQVVMLQRIDSNGQRLFELIECLLWAAHQRKVDGEPVDVVAVFAEVVRVSCAVDHALLPV